MKILQKSPVTFKNISLLVNSGEIQKKRIKSCLYSIKGHFDFSFSRRKKNFDNASTRNLTNYNFQVLTKNRKTNEKSLVYILILV
jgi:hypothetical protein